MVSIRQGGAALALFLGLSAAHAAGLGKLSVNSSLGQVLNAEIDLVSVQPGELDALSARVAPPEAYRDARIEYASSLRLLRFSVEKRPNGQPYLKVTSIAPINEPFVDMLIEVSWPAGRIQREYPILLDPPGYAQARETPPSVPATTSRAPETPPATAPAASSPAPAAAAAEPSAPAAGATGAPSAKAEMGQAARGAAAAGDTYGPVEKGDTLRKIAEQTKPSDVSLEQMLVALYRENQSAFINNNMNRLKTGQILKVPAAEEVGKITRSDAGREIRTHVADWKAYREQLASGASSIAPRAEATNVASGAIGSAAVTPPPAPAAASGDVLKLSKTDVPAGKAGSAKGGGSAQDRVNALQEELTAKDRALQEANSRVADLEKQIRDMQRLIDLKGGVAAPKADTKVAAAPAPAPAPAPAEAAKPAEAPKADAAKPAEAPKVADAGKPDDAAKPAEGVKPAEPPKADATAAPTEPPKVAEAPKPAPPKADAAKPAPRKAPPPKTFTDELLENPAWLAGGVGILALLGIGGFMVARRRKAEAEAEEPSSNMTSAFPSDLKPDATTAKPAGGLVDTGNSSFLTDFDKTGPGTIDTDEVDPVAEAEVYIAYGRDAQAEEILKEAMARDRNRHEIALKLLEIYHARKSATAFETVAKELRASVGESHPLWQKAAAMGAQIDPSNPMYAAAAGGTATFRAMPEAAAAPAAAPKPDLDFDLDTSSTSAQAASAATPDFNLDLDTPQSKAAPASLDFELPAPSPETGGVDVPLEAGQKEQKPSFDFDLSSLDFPSSSKSPAAPDLDLGGGKSSSAMDLADLSLDTAPAAEGGGGEAVGTKLELAKAYLEIGDKDGAREILQEVAKEGSSSQKEEAQKLIASL